VDFIREHKDRREPGGLRWGVEPICAVLCDHGIKIAPSTYYEWKDKLPGRRVARDEAILSKIRQAHTDSFGIYGARKIWLQLNREGTPVARCTVERLMSAAGIKGVTRWRHKRTTIADPALPCPEDLVERQFDPPAPNRLWVADFTYVSTWTGWVYVAFVQDCYSRRILGWQASTTMTCDLVVDALDQAIWTRRQEGHTDFSRLVAHSDHGSQYLSIRHSERLAEAGITPSTGSVGDSYDNAVAETLNGNYKAEVIWHQGPWRTRDHVEYATAIWVDWYNNQRLHEYDEFMPPIQAETIYYQHHEQQPLPLTKK